MSRIGWLIIAVVVLIGAALVYQSRQIDWVENEIGRFFTDDALTQPYLAAYRFLQEQGLSVKHEPGFRRFDQPDTLPPTGDLFVLVNAYGMLSERRAELLLDWVRRGGQLIMAAENPFTDLHRETRDPVFQHFGVGVSAQRGTAPGMASAPACEELPASQPVDFGDAVGSLNIAMPAKVRLIGPSEDDHEPLTNRLLQYELGQGRVTLLAGTAIWRNDFIGCEDHAYMLWQLAPQQGTVRFLENRQGPSIWRLLWRHGAPAVLLLMILVVAMLWGRGVRFGAVRETHHNERRQLMEHVDATGWFLWRQRQQEPLLAPLRQGVLRHAEKRVPGFSGLEPDDQAGRLAVLLNVPAAPINRALFAQPRSENEFVAAVALLRQIRTEL